MRLNLLGGLFFAMLALFVSVFSQAKADSASSIKQTLASYIQGWEHADPTAIAASYAPDGDFINPSGTLSTGRKEIAAFYAGAFAHGYAGSGATATIRKLRNLDANTVLLDGSWSILHARGMQNKIHDEHGMFVAVLVKRAGRWSILALRESYDMH